MPAVASVVAELMGQCTSCEFRGPVGSLATDDKSHFLTVVLNTVKTGFYVWPCYTRVSVTFRLRRTVISDILFTGDKANTLLLCSFLPSLILRNQQLGANKKVICL